MYTSINEQSNARIKEAFGLIKKENPVPINRGRKNKSMG